MGINIIISPLALSIYIPKDVLKDVEGGWF
jgi:hypothetical protein